MHYSVSSWNWVVVPALIVSGVVSVPHPIPSYVDSSIALNAIQSVHIDSNSAQASFVVPCSDCIGGGALDQSFLFDFQAFPTEQPCGTNNLSLNGIPLLQDWESTGVHGQGLAYLNSSGHELNVFLSSDCLHEDNSSLESATQLLTLTIARIDQEKTLSLSGFTLSFKQFPVPELLRLSLEPDYRARDLPDSATWRDPPTNLRISAPAPEETPVTDNRKTLSLEERLKELRELEAQADELINRITEKKNFINSQFPSGAKLLKEKIKACDSFLCVAKAIGDGVHSAANAAYQKLSKSNHTYIKWQPSSQIPSMLSTTSNVLAKPDECHVRDGRPSAGAPTYEGHVVSINEKPPYNSSQPGQAEPEWRDAADPSVIIIVLKFLFVITGLSFIFRLLRLCFMSDRTRVERAAERERRATERLYKCAAKRQSWKDWWHGRRRGQPGYRRGDYDEKRNLILQQEGILEGAMQDEIQQLQIREEIRQLRNTRDAVDDLVRAEEGRGGAAPIYSSSHPFGFRSIPPPITIPTAASGMYPPLHCSDDDTPGTPLSRTSSLPDYKTDASSRPPSYDSDGRSSFGDNDGFSEYEHSIHTTDSIWSPGSSIPDLSPRASVETARTFL